MSSFKRRFFNNYDNNDSKDSNNNKLYCSRNSQDDPDYEKLKRGELPYLDQYSREFNQLLKVKMTI